MKQAQALRIMKAGENVFLTGSAGSGKTFLLNKFIHQAGKRKAVAVTASTGIAATHLGGTTLHSWSGIKVHQALSDQEINLMLEKRYLREHLRGTDILVVDEVSMLHDFQLDLVNRICKVFRQSERPFGGLQVILCGDFFQLPPVGSRRVPGQPANFVTAAASWAELGLRTCYLTESYRHHDRDFLGILNRIRGSTYTPDDLATLQRALDATMKLAITPVRIYTHNADVDAINARELAKIKGEEYAYGMRSHGVPHLVKQLQSNCLAPEELRLKVGAVVMFVKNNFEDGYVNGTMGVVEEFDEDDAPVVRTAQGRAITVRPASWSIEEDAKKLAEIHQLPLRLAWAITVHKSQGMSLDAVEIDLSRTFEYGMGYVALSRVRSLDGLKLLGFNTRALRVDPHVLSLDQLFRNESERNERVFTGRVGAKRSVKKGE